MRTVLLNASSRRALDGAIDSGAPNSYSELSGSHHPLGVLYLAAVLRAHGYTDTMVIDAEAEGLGTDQAVSRILALNPDLVGLSCSTFSFLYALDVARRVKACSRRPIVVGGYHPTLYPEEVLTHDCFDLVAIGEGELILLDLVKAMDRCGPNIDADVLSEVPGVAFRDGGMARFSARRDPVRVLDTIPFPARDLVPLRNYHQTGLPNPSVSIITARGCPFACDFCCKTDHSRNVRYHTPGHVVRELQHVARFEGARSFSIFDDTFMTNRSRIIETCRLLRKQNLGMTFSIQSRVDLIDQEVVVELKRAGCVLVCFGIESGDQDILNALGKRTTVDQARRSIAMCKRAGVGTLAYVVVGAPNETEESIKNTRQMLAETQPDWFIAHILSPYPGSPLYSRLLATGVIPDVWRNMTVSGRPPPQLTISRNFDRRELERVRARINLMPYLRKRTNVLDIRRLVSDPSRAWRSLRWVVANLMGR